jgi:hypothetical protein
MLRAGWFSSQTDEDCWRDPAASEPRLDLAGSGSSQLESGDHKPAAPASAGRNPGSHSADVIHSDGILSSQTSVAAAVGRGLMEPAENPVQLPATTCQELGLDTSIVQKHLRVSCSRQVLSCVCCRDYFGGSGSVTLRLVCFIAQRDVRFYLALYSPNCSRGVL